VQVLAAKRRLTTPGAAALPPSGVDKAAGTVDTIVNPLRGTSTMGGSVALDAARVGGDPATVIAVLQRIEQALNEGLRELRRSSSSTTNSYSTATGYPHIPGRG
jgi:hypothetical protein